LAEEARKLEMLTEPTAVDVARAVELGQRYYELLDELETAEYEIPSVVSAEELDRIAEIMRD